MTLTPRLELTETKWVCITAHGTAENVLLGARHRREQGMESQETQGGWRCVVVQGFETARDGLMRQRCKCCCSLSFQCLVWSQPCHIFYNGQSLDSQLKVCSLQDTGVFKCLNTICFVYPGGEFYQSGWTKRCSGMLFLGGGLDSMNATEESKLPAVMLVVPHN